MIFHTERGNTETRMDIKRDYFLNPGELIVSIEPSLITTVLGSCISVCLYDTQFKIGGMNHFMLPIGSTYPENSLRFGSVAIPRIIEKIAYRTGGKKHLVAKVYGGSDTFNSTYQIGRKNIDLALNILKEHHIKIEDMDVGGPICRKIKFNTYTNEVQLNFLG